MRKRILIWIGLAVASAFVAASVASAAGVLTLSASATKVTYPHSARLTVGNFPTPDSTAAILAMPAGATTWATVAVVTTATPTVSVKPKVTTTYQAWISDENRSTPVTIEVAAHLFKPKIGGNIHKNHKYTIKGNMQPAEVGTVTVSFFRTETVFVKHGKGHVKRVSAWVLHSSVEVALTNLNSNTSRWTTKWKPLESGWWKVVVSHEDLSHVKSSATTFKWVRP
jgi:hypothetical protein